MTYSHAEIIAEIERSIQAGRLAYAAGTPVDQNPLTDRYAQWWTEGWYSEQGGK